MSQEQKFDFTPLWDAVSFDGKESFTLNEDGKLLLHAGVEGRERTVAELTPENGDAVIRDLRDKYSQLQAKIAEVTTEWAATEDKLKMADKVSGIKQQLNQAHMLGDIDALAAGIAEWDQAIKAIYDAHYAVKLQLTEQAETLTESTDWKETTTALKEIIEKWKAAGHSDKHRSDKLWNRIEAVRSGFNERKQKHFEEQEKDLLGNLDLKLDLVEQAESLTTSVEWKKTSDTFHRLTNEWKTIGHTLSKKNEELWQRFIAAKAAFFDRKREHSERIAVEQEQNFLTKSALVEKAEALKDSTEWNNTAIAFAALMEEWKKTGRVSSEKGDELWNRFTAAQEQFFTAKRAHTDAIRTMHDQNYTLKSEILRRADRIKNSTSWSDTTAELNELLDEWKTIGPVAREHSTKIWEDFLAARKHFFARKDANRDQRKQQFVSQKETRAVQAKEMVAKLLSDIQEEEEKQVDFKAALDNVTPGKKAGELRKHLEQLIAEGEQKIKRLKEKYAAVQDEYGKQAEDAAKAIAKAAAEAPAVTEPAEVTATEATTTEAAPEQAEVPATEAPEAAAPQPVAEEPAALVAEAATAVAETPEVADATPAAEETTQVATAETTPEPAADTAAPATDEVAAATETENTEPGKEQA